MDVICEETIRLVEQATFGQPLDLSYTIDGLNIQQFFEVNCGAPPWVGNLSVNVTVEEEYDPEYFSHTYRLVGTFFQGVIFLIGLLGNVMVVAVVAKTKSMHTTTNCYLVSLAVADVVVLLAAVPNEILSYYLIGGKWLYGAAGCSLFVFSQNLGINASTLSLTAFTVERYIAICHPMKAQTMCTVARAKRIIAAVWLCSIVYCSPWLGLTSLTRLPYKGFDNVHKCTFKLSREAYTYYYLTDFFVFYVVPLLLSVVLYSLIARILFQSQALKSSNGKTSAGRSGAGNGTLTVDSTRTNAARVQVVKMLVMVVVIFAVLWLPYRGMLVYNSFVTMFGGESFMDLWFLMFVKTCIYINSAINPILYNAMSVKFRRAFSRTLFCGRARGGASFRAGGYGGGRNGRGHTNATYSTATVITTTPTNYGGLPQTNRLDSSPDGPTTTLLIHSSHHRASSVGLGLRQNHSSRKRSQFGDEFEEDDKRQVVTQL